jgi:hypothetical protein
MKNVKTGKKIKKKIKYGRNKLLRKRKFLSSKSNKRTKIYIFIISLKKAQK